jgi:hypothetical protein
MDESLRMQCDEDCRTAGFGKTERPVGWEGNGEPITMGLVRHCEGKPAATDRLHLPSLSHSFTLDWLLGFSGPRDEAEQIKVRMREFLQDELKLELSQEKTLVTNARTEAARFLGYEIINQHADDKHCRKQRSINGASGLKVPVDVIRKKCLKYMRHGKPIQRAERLNDTDFSIIAQYQAEYRGVVQYYLKAFNVHRLRQLYQVMKLSLAKTLADKNRTSVAKVIRKYQTTVPTPHGRLKVLQAIRQRDEKKKPLVARFGGIELRRQKDAVINDRPPEVYNSLRSEIVQRLLADQCELCGSEDNCEVHHVRKLADLDQPGQKEKRVPSVSRRSREKSAYSQRIFPINRYLW